MRRLLSISVASGLLLAGAAVYFYQISQPGTVRVRFDAVIGDKPLVFNDARYSNPGGAGMFRIRDFQFFISNIDLHSEKGVYRVPDSYYLARFDNSSTSYQIDLANVPQDWYSAITFSLGVDEVANGSIISVGDLDPNSRMAWNWEVGYKFLLFEGALIDGDTIRPLVYHVGFNENRKTLRFNLPEEVAPDSSDALLFTVDVLALFTGKNTVDMVALPNVKFDRDDARLLAGNYGTMISLTPTTDDAE
jgi:hypothetical protein